jgi:hypothetical protein
MREGTIQRGRESYIEREEVEREIIRIWVGCIMCTLSLRTLAGLKMKMK